jgi:hypothetical protein
VSAWIVSKEHIDVLVDGVMQSGGYRHRGRFVSVVTQEDADALGTMLWKENHKSINSRYSEYGKKIRTPEYHFKHSDDNLVPATMAKQIACYDYQSSEHGEYYPSRSYSVVLHLSRDILQDVSGYEDAKWGV